jgi:hypothetical protein
LPKPRFTITAARHPHDLAVDGLDRRALVARRVGGRRRRLGRLIAGAQLGQPMARADVVAVRIARGGAQLVGLGPAFGHDAVEGGVEAGPVGHGGGVYPRTC